MLLKYISGECYHTIVINSGLNVMYDCMETHELELNQQNLCKWCGPNFVFARLCIAVELSNNKVHEKTLKMK